MELQEKKPNKIGFDPELFTKLKKLAKKAETNACNSQELEPGLYRLCRGQMKDILRNLYSLIGESDLNTLIMEVKQEMIKDKNGGAVQLKIKCLDGVEYNITLPDTSTVDEVKQTIYDISQIPIEDQRLIFAGKQLEDGRLLSEYNIYTGSVLHLVKRLRGDIGIFGQHEDSLCREHLLSDEFKDQKLSEIKNMIQRLKGDLDSKFTFIERIQNFDASSLRFLKIFADRQYQELSKGLVTDNDDINDLKINITKEKLLVLLGPDAFEELENYFDDSYNEIVIRRCQMHGKFINFHTDVSLKTLQLALNGDDEYEGGRLVYACEGGQLVAPRRPAGSVTIHDNKIVHGVSTLKSGTRYGLFLLKKKY